MRKMATIRRISAIESIPEADRICVYVVDGWKVVDSIGKYNVGDLVVYCEIDSFIPNAVAPFLTASDRFPKEYLGVKGECLKTKKLRGVISQGLLLPTQKEVNGYRYEYPYCALDDIRQNTVCLKEGEDASPYLGIVKYAPPLPAQLAGQAKGNFPSLVPKTDEERVQNLSKYWDKYSDSSLTWEVTEKLEGSSCTFYLDKEGNFEVCSRNLSLKEDDNNSFWKAAKMYNVKQKMLDNNLQGFAIQGELIGEGIQGNIYNIKGVDFYVYKVWDTGNSKYLKPEEQRQMCNELGLKYVPVISEDSSMFSTIDAVLTYAEDKSKLNSKQEREGVVWKCNENPELHFKVISNKYLLKSKD